MLSAMRSEMALKRVPFTVWPKVDKGWGCRRRSWRNQHPMKGEGPVAHQVFTEQYVVAVSPDPGAVRRALDR